MGSTDLKHVTVGERMVGVDPKGEDCEHSFIKTHIGCDFDF
jgi:hypothetical protein